MGATESWYLVAFWELDTERSRSGTTVGPIPWSSILMYASWSGLDRDTTDVFVAVIRSMDGAYLRDLSERYRREAERRSRGGSGGGRQPKPSRRRPTRKGAR